MAQPCVATSIKALEKIPIHNDKFFKFLDITAESVFDTYKNNVVDPEMRQYCNPEDQVPCSKEILERILHCFTEQKFTIRYYISQMMRGAHEKGGLAYKVEEHILYLEIPPIIHFDNIKTFTKDKSVMIDEITPDINDYAFVLRSSKSRNGEIGAGHMMLMKYDVNLVKNLEKGLPESGLE